MTNLQGPPFRPSVKDLLGRAGAIPQAGKYHRVFGGFHFDSMGIMLHNGPVIKRVYLIEDEVMVLDFCSEYIRNFTDMEIVGSSGNGHDALKGVMDTKPDLVVVDIRLPEVNGLEILNILKRKLPEAKVLIFTATVNPHTIRTALQGGTDAFVEKAEGLQGLKNGIEAIKQNKRYFSPHIKSMMAPYADDLSSKPPFSGDDKPAQDEGKK